MWTVEIGDTVLDPTRALDITRNIIGPNRSSVTIAFEQPQQLHRITDPEVGDNLFVVTALPPARGFINEQDFIEFHALASTQGVVVEPLADDVNVELAAGQDRVGRPGGLTLSASLQTLLHGSGLRPVMFNSQVWGFDREGILYRTPIAPHRSRRGRAGKQAARAAARSGALLSGARHVSRKPRASSM